jgi:hypothetical protein
MPARRRAIRVQHDTAFRIAPDHHPMLIEGKDLPLSVAEKNADLWHG